MTPGVKSDLCAELSNNNVIPLIPRASMHLEFKDVTCTLNTFDVTKFRFGKLFFFIYCKGSVLKW